MSNRSTLLEHALALFAERGYDAVGVKEICEAASVTKPTLYHYFGSKRGLLLTLVRERYAPLRDELRAAARYDGDLPGTLARVVRAWFAFAERDPRMARLVLSLWFASPASEAVQVTGPCAAEQVRMLEGMFAAAAQNHGNMRGRQRAYALSLLGAIHSYAGLALNGGGTLDDSVARQVVHQFSHGIYS
ncbi:TetR/AcrR family transcriptional regulator [Longimicrobium terrae]|uniref:TetR/AcrR family transcriptional regulator n=1 Tax=Longimicrobium terrae TaxID=1639882 RepID=A0A841GZI1_9BACT|nr:TetR/AcrR family transcriptional regulator [Longimicrobium terrae]MBB4636838.1 TetR/AcrR family transcriptional regulator [Longimicrobium terrae]MBB6071162.1 TetR/AcrR family transcriptional regulator [Longimicrobium terrae]NNC29211.1 TetR/AcrR family transcriptional regulator [Longimicrobium terrae]